MALDPTRDAPYHPRSWPFLSTGCSARRQAAVCLLPLLVGHHPSEAHRVRVLFFGSSKKQKAKARKEGKKKQAGQQASRQAGMYVLLQATGTQPGRETREIHVHEEQTSTGGELNTEQNIMFPLWAGLDGSVNQQPELSMARLLRASFLLRPLLSSTTFTPLLFLPPPLHHLERSSSPDTQQIR